ncbi:MAG: sigma-54-dependent Fis family transcriptional regulator, partial [Gemmatimonadetes bacterium]|nr:sigma-54-dependent Fis family transcriptional regulator [Gemmatimonadota bacterium]
AQAVHYASDRADAPFVAVDCSAIPATLMESQFFGHERGAFTDAQQARPGYFEQADGGTLFLDEIGDMSLDLQSRLLRTLETRQVRRVGAEQTVPVDVRVVAATHRDLAECVRQGLFREDLYYRVESFVIQVPSLRARCEDIHSLAEHFVHRYARELRKPVQELSLAAIERLQSHDFPGNVRELRNIIERSVILCEQSVVDENHLSLQSKPATIASGEAEDGLSLDAAEQRVIRRALEQAAGHRGEAARLLGISRDALRRRLQRLGMDDAS